MTYRLRKAFLWVLSRTLNRLTRRLARWGVGPFSVVRHVGRTSGKVYETPLMLARVAEGLIAELTYGPDVAWYRNVIAANGCEIVRGRTSYRIDRIEPYPTEAGRRAFGVPARYVLTLLRRNEFRLLHIADEVAPEVAP